MSLKRTLRRQVFETVDARVDRLRGVGRARASRSSTTGPTSAPITSSARPRKRGLANAWPNAATGAQPPASPALRSPPELADVGALRLERRAQQRRPSRRSRARAPRRPRPSARRSTSTSTVGPAPEIVAPSAPRSAARDASSYERGNSERAVLLVQAVVRARARAGPSRRVRGRASSSDAWATLKTASVIGTSLGQRGARRARAHRLGRDDGQRLQPVGGSKRVDRAVGADRRSRRAATRRRCRGGPRARSRARAGQRRARRGGRRPSGPRRSPPRWSRGRRPAGSPRRCGR